MALERAELAARCLVALLHDATTGGTPADRAGYAVRCADALLAALVPVAPASGAPATEPYRGADCLNMIGAVIDYYGQAFIVTSHGCSQLLGHPRSLACGHATPSAITFSRWATREECERHGIPYVTRPLPGAPLAAPSRPEWVRITGPEDAEDVTIGKAYRVLGWTDVRGGRPSITNDAGVEWVCAGPNEDGHDTLPKWEPHAAPGETAGPAAAMPGVSPAATPAAWVPSVGDVVTWSGLRHDYIVTFTSPQLGGKYISDGIALDWFGGSAPYDCTYLRPATSSERAAAGLPVDESATKPVDREGLAGAIWRSFNDESPDRRFDTIGVYERESYLKAADAVVAFMAKRGAS